MAEMEMNVRPEQAMIDLSKLVVGDKLTEHVQGPISRGTLALFAGASNDHVLLHIDSDYAKAAGLPDVFGQGMLSMAYLAQLLTHWVSQERLRAWNVRFTAITPLYATIHCRGEVVEIMERDGARIARVHVEAQTAEGLKTLDGEALITIN